MTDYDNPWLRLVYLLGLSLALVVGINNLAGCGSSVQEQHAAHITLNTLTEVSDPTYQLAVDSCDAARDAIVAREGTTYASDRAAMNTINDACDAIVLGFETLRGTQLTARAAIDSGLTSAAATAILEALEAWEALKALVPELATLGQTAGGEN